MSDKMIGYCGYSCYRCAARSDDPAVRQRLVDGWRRLFGHEHYTVENVRCDGCLADGRLADKECKARPCARERGVASCALCDDFVCEKVGNLLASREGMFVFNRRRSAQATEEEFNLCMRQFDSLPNLVKIMAEAGKLPEWTLRRTKTLP